MGKDTSTSKIDYSLLKEAKRHRAVLVAYDHAVSVLQAAQEAEGALGGFEIQLAGYAERRDALQRENETLQRENETLQRENKGLADKNGRELAAFKADFSKRREAKQKEFDAFSEDIERKKEELQKEFDDWRTQEFERRKAELAKELSTAERATRLARKEANKLMKQLSGDVSAESGDVAGGAE